MAWTTNDIWIRRAFELKEVSDNKLALLIRHDEDTEVYINGKLIASASGYTASYEKVLLEKKVKDVLHSGTNTIAVHCHQTEGGQFLDLGLSEY